MLAGAILFPDHLPRSMASVGLALVVFSPLAQIDFGKASRRHDEESE
jgi:hypothetical protein